MSQTNRAERLEQILTLFSEGHSIRTIGKKVSLSYEAVRIDLIRAFGNAYEEKLREFREKRRVTPVPVEAFCKTCGASFMLKPGSNRRNCHLHTRYHKRLNIYPEWAKDRGIKKKNFTPEEWKIINRIKTTSYYQRTKDVRRAKIRAYQDANRDKRLIYVKRCLERRKYGHAITPLVDPKNMDAVKP